MLKYTASVVIINPAPKTPKAALRLPLQNEVTIKPER